MADQPQDLRLGDWYVKIREPQGGGPHPVIFLIHGWTGDERSMWIFASRLPKSAWLLAPRAPYPSISREHGGYSWVPRRSSQFSTLKDFDEGRHAFNNFLKEWSQERGEKISTFSLLGFSQGAAFCYAYVLQQPEKIEKMAGLAGFLPEGAEQFVDQAPLRDKKVYVAHGLRDQTVPIALARHSRDVLTRAGADVQYCEADIGHKLAADCFRGLAEFFS